MSAVHGVTDMLFKEQHLELQMPSHGVMGKSGMSR